MPVIPKHTTQADWAVQQYGTVAALFDIALLNNASITDDLVPGADWQLPEAVYEITAPQLPARALQPKLPVFMPVHSSLADLAQKQNGSIAALFELGILNGISITDEPEPGTVLFVSPEQQPITTVQLQQRLPITDTVVIKRHQSLADWATQHWGSLDAIFQMAALNGLSVTDEPEPGTLLQRMVKEASVVNYYINRGTDIVSLKTAAQIKPGGIGFMQIGNDFKVS